MASITKIFNQSIVDGVASMHLQPLSVEQQMTWFTERDSRYAVIVCLRQGRVVGWAALSPWEKRQGYRLSAESSVYVDSECQGQGIGKLLLIALIEEARRHGFHCLIAQVARGAAASIALHERCGFRLIGTLKEVGFKYDQWVDVDILQLPLAIQPEPIGYFNGRIVPQSSIQLSIDDWGVRQGAIVSDMLRTFAGKIHLLEEHVSRLEQGMESVGIEFPGERQQICDAAEKVVEHNYRLLAAGQDLGISILVTPGLRSVADSEPTVGIHTAPLPFSRWAARYQAGQRLITVATREIPGVCIPRHIKSRSRLHYFLAEKQARQQDPQARALLLDIDDAVAEACTAAVVVYDPNTGLVSPPADKVLGSISWQFAKRLADKLGIAHAEADLALADVYSASEVLWCSTPMCLLPVTQVDDRPIGDGSPGPVFQQLMQAWSDDVGVDIIAQAQRPSGIAATP